jgi:hypothetical protein
MNERFKELAEQAKFMAEEEHNRQISYNAELKAFAEKFAELLIRDVVATAMRSQSVGRDFEWVVLNNYGMEIEE